MLSIFGPDLHIADALWLIAAVLFVVGTVIAVMQRSTYHVALGLAGLAFTAAGFMFTTG